ncbi:MAG: glucose-6-phosphate isomerase [Planctomycetes bacterium]|nr:glucose-6-phosphate isomerase [Planctomycetota bacterium]
MSIARSEAWKKLAAHARVMRKRHLRDLLPDAARARAMCAEHDGVFLDYSRQLATPETLRLLVALARSARLAEKIEGMYAGECINATEDRPVLHHALRAAEDEVIEVDGADVVRQVYGVQHAVHRFVERVRDGEFLGATGRRLTNVVAIGIGGSYLGPEFVAESLATDPECRAAAAGRTLRFLANVDPIDTARALAGLMPERTLAVIVSKTFTTAETMLNARAVRAWLQRSLGQQATARHMVAVSTNAAAVAQFGLDPDNMFGFWDWVGGRYSVCSAVGLVPLALHYGFAPLARFLAGARSMDRHFFSAGYARNLPMLLALFGVWNSSFLGFPARALLPYCQALHRFAAHVQQVDMESNGKGVALDGKRLPFAAGEIDFGEPGTNGQHSFYQLLHQGRTVPADFIGFRRSQQPLEVESHPVSNHDELMANFFAQPDALACGRTAEECAAAGIPARLIPHKVFPGNRPSNVLLLPVLDPYTTGQLLALYEHRTAVQGFIWDVNSFDQMGVELGKTLALRVREQIARSRSDPDARIKGFNPATSALLKRYLS